MTDQELEEVRAQEAAQQALIDFSEIETPASYTFAIRGARLALRLARDKWAPPDPILVAAGEILDSEELLMSNLGQHRRLVMRALERGVQIGRGNRT